MRRDFLVEFCRAPIDTPRFEEIRDLMTQQELGLIRRLMKMFMGPDKNSQAGWDLVADVIEVMDLEDE